MRRCRVTVWDPTVTGQQLRHTHRPCGLPAVVGSRLCRGHDADRIRLIAPPSSNINPSGDTAA